MRRFEELSLKEIKKQYDLGEKYCIDYLKKFDSEEYNESLQDILSELNIDNSILCMNIEEIPDKGYLEGELINDLKNLNDNDSYTVARLKNVCHCVELHYRNGSPTIEYGIRLEPGYWESEIEDVEWFDKNMSDDELFDKLEELFKDYFGEEEFIYKNYNCKEIKRWCEMEEVYTNCYGSLSVYKNKNDALKFYNECFLLSEGAERERYASILFSINNNESIEYDNFSKNCGEIYIHTNNYFERPLKIDLDSMLSFKDCIKYYKDSLKPLLDVCNEFDINFNNNSPFEEFGADNEFNMRSITDFYIELLKKKKINFDNITTNEVSDGKYELVIDNNFVLDTRVWDDFNSVIDNVNSIEEYSKKRESEKEYE